MTNWSVPLGNEAILVANRYGEHEVALRFHDKNVAAYAFTFVRG
jgi:hypothetical protein